MISILEDIIEFKIKAAALITRGRTIVRIDNPGIPRTSKNR